MTLFSFLLLLLIAAIAGGIGQLLGGVDFPVVWAIIGGGVVVAVLGLVFGRARGV